MRNDRPNLSNLPPEVQSYIYRLETHAPTQGLRNFLDRNAVSIVMMIIVFGMWLFGLGGQWQSMRALDSRLTSIEAKVDAVYARDSPFANKDLIELRLNELRDKLDILTAEVKAVKSAVR